MATLLESLKRAETTDKIAMAKFYASYEDNGTKRQINSSNKFKERENNGKKHRKKKSSLYCSLRGENKSHASGECNVLNKRAKDKDNPKYVKKGLQEEVQRT